MTAAFEAFKTDQAKDLQHLRKLEEEEEQQKRDALQEELRQLEELDAQVAAMEFLALSELLPTEAKQLEAPKEPIHTRICRGYARRCLRSSC